MIVTRSRFRITLFENVSCRLSESFLAQSISPDVHWIMLTFSVALFGPVGLHGPSARPCVAAADAYIPLSMAPTECSQNKYGVRLHTTAEYYLLYGFLTVQGSPLDRHKLPVRGPELLIFY